jgi:ribosomal protein S18 acetylase RimI-like enzyme
MSSNVEQCRDFAIVELDPTEWVAYKVLRLDALKNEPTAFATSWASASQDSDEKWKERLQSVADGKCWYLFARDPKQELVGMIGAFPAKDENKMPIEGVAEIIAVYVKADERGKGISSCLLEGIVSRLSATGIFKKARLSVNIEAESAIKLYQNHGFTIVGKPINHKLGDGKPHALYNMERTL